MKPLSPFQKAFVKEYVANGFNGTRAVLKLKPHLQYETAGKDATLLVKNERVKEEIDRLTDKKVGSSIASREVLIERANRIGLKAEEKESYQTALNSVEVMAKLNGLYVQDTPDMQGYIALMQQIIIVDPAKKRPVVAVGKRPMATIDIEKVEEGESKMVYLERTE